MIKELFVYHKGLGRRYLVAVPWSLTVEHPRCEFDFLPELGAYSATFSQSGKKITIVLVNLFRHSVSDGRESMEFLRPLPTVPR